MKERMKDSAVIFFASVLRIPRVDIRAWLFSMHRNDRAKGKFHMKLHHSYFIEYPTGDYVKGDDKTSDISKVRHARITDVEQNVG